MREPAGLQELYAPIKGRRTWKILVAAGYTGNDVKEIGVDMMSGEHKTKKFLAMNPLGKVREPATPHRLLPCRRLTRPADGEQVPVLKTAEGTVFESNAIARYGGCKESDRSPPPPYTRLHSVQA